MKFTKTIDVQLPTLPNYLKAANGEGLDIAELTDDQIEELAKEWLVALKDHAARRRIMQATPQPRRPLGPPAGSPSFK